MLQNLVYAGSGFVLGVALASALSRHVRRQEMRFLYNAIVQYHLKGSDWVSVQLSTVKLLFGEK